jgi:hypothetical protein
MQPMFKILRTLYGVLFALFKLDAKNLGFRKSNLRNEIDQNPKFNQQYNVSLYRLSNLD